MSIIRKLASAQPELDFEKDVISYLVEIDGTKHWQYAQNIKTTAQLWDNFRDILFKNNRDKLENPLSDVEFNQVKAAIINLNSAYKAGQFLYGTNGISKVEVDLDNGKHVFLTVFDQSQIGAGNTVYQVVNQIRRPRVNAEREDRRFDVTLLINGLPIIQIELKNGDLEGVHEAFNQMQQYIEEKQYGDIFSTLQVLIAMTPYNTRYLANTAPQRFNERFAFQWQKEKDNEPIRNWKDFIDQVLRIPMAHRLATQFMILDGTENRESIKVMRPYQVYATQRVLEKVDAFDFNSPEGKLGYVWHTTGSGKTITSFKTAWLASRKAKVDLVVFLVDRIALTNQTTDAYRAYDPNAAGDTDGVIEDTANVEALQKKLTRTSDKNIIVTSIQKMDGYVKDKKFKPLNKHILFIVDEAHRSTSSSGNDIGRIERIREHFPNAGWVGYTGTPKFPETAHIFGEPIHIYNIKDAIADKNVLGFHVDYKETIQLTGNDGNAVSIEEIEKKQLQTAYDTDPRQVQLVAQDIFDNWDRRSAQRRYNAILTVHLGGKDPSIPRAVEYFNQFQALNETLPEEQRLKVAVSFSQTTSNNDHQLDNNNSLSKVITAYNNMFGTPFDLSTVKKYAEDVARRLNKTASDGKFLDLLIVVDQFLTGFDAPQLNTLYVDRTLNGANLIQAYSRTNRLSASSKPWGNIINYRWPKLNRDAVNEAFALYANRNSANEQLSLEELEQNNKHDGIIAPSHDEVTAKVEKTISILNQHTNNGTMMPRGEHNQEEFCNAYKNLEPQLQQYIQSDDSSSSDSADKEKISAVIDPQILGKFKSIFEDIQDERRQENPDSVDTPLEEYTLDFILQDKDMQKIDYDYLTQLIADVATKKNEGDVEGAALSYEKAQQEIKKQVSNIQERKVYLGFVDDIYSGKRMLSNPEQLTVDELKKLIAEWRKDYSADQITDFIQRFGLETITTHEEIASLLKKYHYHYDDMNRQDEADTILNKAFDIYQEAAADALKTLEWPDYRQIFRKELEQLARKLNR